MVKWLSAMVVPRKDDLIRDCVADQIGMEHSAAEQGWRKEKRPSYAGRPPDDGNDSQEKPRERRR